MVLEGVNTWCGENKLTLNGSKTEYIIHGSKVRNARGSPIQLWMGGLMLRQVNSYKYLDTTLDATLNGTQLALKLTTFRKIRAYVSENTELQL